MPDTFVAHQQFDGHGVKHFIAQHHARHGGRQRIRPMHDGCVGRQRLLLPFTKGARHIHNRVARNRRTLASQFIQHVTGQRPGACAKLPNFRTLRRRKRLRDLRGEGLAKQSGHFWRGHEVTALPLHALRHPAEFIARVGVIAQTGAVQRQRHEGIKRQPAASLPNCLGNMRMQGVR